MAIKRGDVISHSAAEQWGVGKVVELGDTSASIHFSDGFVRKISASHFGSLVPALPSSFVPLVLPDAPKVAKAPKAPRAPKAAKEAKAASPRQKKAVAAA